MKPLLGLHLRNGNRSERLAHLPGLTSRSNGDVRDCNSPHDPNDLRHDGTSSRVFGHNLLLYRFHYTTCFLCEKKIVEGALLSHNTPSTIRDVISATWGKFSPRGFFGFRKK